jgi:hypothetical protein
VENIGVYGSILTVRLSASYTPTTIALLEEFALISDWYDTKKKELIEEDIL